MEIKKLLGYPESIAVAKTASLVTSEVVPEAFPFEDNGRQPPRSPLSLSTLAVLPNGAEVNRPKLAIE